MNTFAGVVSERSAECGVAELRAMLPTDVRCELCQMAAFGAATDLGGAVPLRLESGENGGRILALLSGRLENVAELRLTAERHGRSLVSGSPEELLIHLYEIYGSDMFGRLKGAFAVAVYDSARRRLLLGRDLVGAEPLYYFIHRNVLVFSGRFGILAKHPLAPREIDESAVSTFLSLQYIPEPDTIFRGVRKLPPGHLLEFHLETGTPSIRAFAKWNFSVKSSDLSFDDAKRKLREIVEAGVSSALADGNTGVFLSGGVDSTILAALAARCGTGGKVEVFTVGFADAAYDERALAESSVGFINRQTGGKLHHNVCELPPLPLELARMLAEFHGEPYADASVLPTHLLCKFASGQVGAALGGDGGDEFFSGYERYRAMKLASQFEILPEALRRSLFTGLAKCMPDSGERTFGGRCRRMFKLLGDPSRAAYFHLLDRCPAELKKRLFGERLRDALWHDSSEAFARWEWELSTAHPVESFAELDIHTYLPGDGCAKLNIAAGAAGIEIVTPYLGSGVTTLSAHLPPEFKIRGRNRKRILKAAFADILPPDLARRRKRGFGVPVASWLRDHWRSGAEEVLFGSSLCPGGFVVRDELRNIWDEHQSGRADYSYLIWSLINLAWFIDRK